MENIKLYKYFQLSDSEMMYYTNVFQFVKPLDKLDTYQAKKLTSLPFGEITRIKKLAAEADFQSVFYIVFGISKDELINMRVTDFFMALNWVRQELELLIEREKHLVGEEDPKMAEAGSARLNVFKEMNILIPMSKEYGKTIEEIASWKYSTVFAIMYHEKVSRDVEREYNRLTTAK